MAMRKLCCAPGCDDLAEAGDNRCADHRAEQDAKIAARKTAAKSTAQAADNGKHYKTRAWQDARRVWLSRHPLCVDCQSVGIVMAANEVDHITPHRGDLKLFWNRRNWQSLCKPCHSRKTAREVFHPRIATGG